MTSPGIGAQLLSPVAVEDANIEATKGQKDRVTMLPDSAKGPLYPPSSASFNVVVSGHSHRPLVEERDGVLFVNPGTAGPRRFQLPISVGRLTIVGEAVRAEIIELSV